MSGIFKLEDLLKEPQQQTFKLEELLGPDTTATKPVSRAAPPVDMSGEDGDVVRGLKTGWQGLVGTLGNTMRLLSKNPLHFDASVRAGLEIKGREIADRARARRAEIPGPRVRLKDIKSVDDAVDWAQYSVSQGIVSSLPALVAGIATGGVGALTTGYLQAQDEVTHSLQEEGLDETSADALASIMAAPIGALDAIFATRLAGKFTGEVKKKVIKRITQRVLEEAGKSGVIEGITEAAQSAISQATVAAATGKPFSLEQLLEEGVAGALTGGVMGGGASVFEKGEAPSIPSTGKMTPEQAKARVAEVTEAIKKKQADRRTTFLAWNNGTPAMRKALIADLPEEAYNQTWKQLDEATKVKIVAARGGAAPAAEPTTAEDKEFAVTPAEIDKMVDAQIEADKAEKAASVSNLKPLTPEQIAAEEAEELRFRAERKAALEAEVEARVSGANIPSVVKEHTTPPKGTPAPSNEIVLNPPTTIKDTDIEAWLIDEIEANRVELIEDTIYRIRGKRYVIGSGAGRDVVALDKPSGPASARLESFRRGVTPDDGDVLAMPVESLRQRVAQQERRIANPPFPFKPGTKKKLETELKIAKAALAKRDAQLAAGAQAGATPPQPPAGSPAQPTIGAAPAPGQEGPSLAAEPARRPAGPPSQPVPAAASAASELETIDSSGPLQSKSVDELDDLIDLIDDAVEAGTAKADATGRDLAKIAAAKRIVKAAPTVRDAPPENHYSSMDEGQIRQAIAIAKTIIQQSTGVDRDNAVLQKQRLEAELRWRKPVAEINPQNLKLHVNELQARQKYASTQEEYQKIQRRIEDVMRRWKEISLDNLSSMMRSGENMVGAGFDRSVFQKLGATLYKGKLAVVVVKEGLQNSIDAVRATPNARVAVKITQDAEKNSVIVFDDNGVGMSPEVAANEFMDIGGSSKLEGSTGGFGLAKVGLLANAKHFSMTTVARAADGTLHRTTIAGTADDWVAGTLKYSTEQVQGVETGTKLAIKFGESMEFNPWAGEQYLERAKEYSRQDVSDSIKLKGRQRKEINDVPAVVTTELPGANVSIYVSEASVTKPDGRYVGVHILNNGLYQLSTGTQIKGRGPEFIVIDIEPKVALDDMLYPFTSSREQIKGAVDDWISQRLGDIALTSAMREAQELVRRLDTAPTTVRGLKVIDTAGTMSPSVAAAVVDSKSSTTLINVIVPVLSRVGEILQRNIGQILGPSASSRFDKFDFAGWGISRGYLGMNVSGESIEAVRNQAKTGKVPDYGWRSRENLPPNLILINPYVIHLEIAELIQKKMIMRGNIARALAQHTMGTIIHEILHEAHRDHETSFAGAITRAMSVVYDSYPEATEQLTHGWSTALTEDFDEVYEQVSSEWNKDADDAFLSIGSALGPVSGSPISGDLQGSSVSGAPSSTGSGTPGGATTGTVVAASSGTGQSQKPSAAQPPGGPPPGGSDKVADDYDDMPEYVARIAQTQEPSRSTEPVMTALRRTLGRAYAGGIRKSAPLEEAGARLTAGADVPSGLDPSKAAVLHASGSSMARAQGWLFDQPFLIDQEGNRIPLDIPSLQSIVDLAGDDRWLSAYEVAQEALDQAERYGKDIGVDLVDAQLTVANAPENVKQAAALKRRFEAALIQYGEGKLFEQGLAAKFMTNFPVYARIVRMFEGKPLGTGKLIPTSKKPGKTIPQQQPIKARKGSQLQIQNTVLSTVEQTMRIIRASDQAELRRLFADWGDANPEAAVGYIEPIREARVKPSATEQAQTLRLRQEAKEGGVDLTDNEARQLQTGLSDEHLNVTNDVLVINRNGKLLRRRVSPEIAYAFRSFGPSEMGMLWKLLGVPPQVLKQTIVNHPSFSVSQFILDSLSGFVMSRYGFIPIASSFRGWFDILRDSPQHKAFKSIVGELTTLADEGVSGGGLSEITGRTRTSRVAERLYERTKIKPGGTELESIINAVRGGHPIVAYRKAIASLAQAHKVAEFIMAKEHGASDVDAALQALELGGNFAMSGASASARALRGITLFVNPAVQYFDALAKAVKRNPKQTFARAVVGIAVPSALLWLANHDDEEINQLRKTRAGRRYWFIRLPDQTIFKVRKPYLEGQIFGTGMEIVLDQLESKNPDEIRSWIDATRREMVAGSIGPLFTIPVSLWGNKDWSLGVPIVPDGMQNVEEAYQAAMSTGTTARVVGTFFGMSPAKIEYVVRNLGGLIADDALRAVDIGINYYKYNEVPAKEELPIVRRFMSQYPTSNVAALEQFYDNASRMEKVGNTIALLKRGAPGKLESYVQEHATEVALVEVYGKARAEIAQLRQTIELLRNVTRAEMPLEDRKRTEHQLLRTMAEIAASINQATMQMRHNTPQAASR